MSCCYGYENNNTCDSIKTGYYTRETCHLLNNEWGKSHHSTWLLKNRKSLFLLHLHEFSKWPLWMDFLCSLITNTTLPIMQHSRIIYTFFSSLFLFLKKYRKLLLKMKGKCCVVHALCIIEHASLQKGFCHTSLWIQMKTAFSGFIAIFQKQCTTCIENNNSGGICVHFCIKYTVKKWTFNALLQLLTR